MTRRPRRYLITGDTSGIGLAVAGHLSASGDRVWITGTSTKTLDAALAHGVAEGGSICDIATPTAVEAAFDEAVKTFGGLDGVFANAGIDGGGGPADEVDLEQFRRVLEVNVLGTFTTAQTAHRHLSRPGVLVLNSSVNALRPELHFVDYNVSKAAVAALAQSLALDWSAQRLSVVAIAPGYFRSRMTSSWLDDPAESGRLLQHIPAERFGELPEIAQMVAFLLSGASGFMTGAVVPIAGAANV